MYLSYALYQTIDESGRIESYHIYPDMFSHLITNRLRDVDGIPQRDEFDLGPLRFYQNEGGIKFKRNVYQLSSSSFKKLNDKISFSLNHVGLPIQRETVGFYAILLPENFDGDILSDNHFEKYWLADKKRLLLTTEISSTSRDIFIKGDLSLSLHESDHGSDTSQEVYKNKIHSLHETNVRNFLRAVNRSINSNAPSAFICHSSSDKEIARKISLALAGRDIKIWLDESEIKIGDSLIQKIERGILNTNKLIILLSKKSTSSSWCKEELRMALSIQINDKKIVVLPVLIEDCEIPGFLMDKKYADFRKEWSFEESIEDLCDALTESET